MSTPGVVDQGRRTVSGASAYSVDADGKVYSTLDCSRTGYLGGVAREMRPGLGRNGYRVVRLKCDDGVVRTRYVHHLVAEAFLGPRPEWHEEVRHLDGRKLNCAASNLAWGTRRDNSGDSRRHGSMIVGSRSHLAKLRENDVAKIKKLHADGARVCELARRFGVNHATISAIRTGKTWAHVPAQE